MQKVNRDKQTEHACINLMQARCTSTLFIYVYFAECVVSNVQKFLI